MYDVFISYRREGGSEIAHHVYDRLRGHNILAFLDVEEMRSGPFNTQLYKRIEECEKMVLILPPNGLDRCKSEDDWVRLEIEHALKLNKTIIPMLLRNFAYPDDLPDSLKCLPNFQSIIASDEYFDATIEKLIKLIDVSAYGGPIANAKLDIRTVRSFADCGMENTIFKIKKCLEGNQLDVKIDFEPSRIRKDVPSFAGIYLLLEKSYEAEERNCLTFYACSPDDSLAEVQVEIKPEGKKWMHETFNFELTSQMQKYEVDFSEFLYKKTLNCIEEITFVFTPEYFADKSNLRGSFTVKDIKIESN